MCLSDSFLDVYQNKTQSIIQISIKHRIGWIKVERESNKNGECSLQELDLTVLAVIRWKIC